MNCTWADCSKEAAHQHLDKDGKEWCNLCDDHHNKLELGMDSADVKIILSNWVKAQGGAKKATERMKPAIETGTKLMRALTGNTKYKFDTSTW